MGLVETSPSLEGKSLIPTLNLEKCIGMYRGRCWVQLEPVLTRPGETGLIFNHGIVDYYMLDKWRKNMCRLQKCPPEKTNRRSMIYYYDYLFLMPMLHFSDCCCSTPWRSSLFSSYPSLATLPRNEGPPRINKWQWLPIATKWYVVIHELMWFRALQVKIALLC